MEKLVIEGLMKKTIRGILGNEEFWHEVEEFVHEEIMGASVYLSINSGEHGDEPCLEICFSQDDPKPWTIPIELISTDYAASEFRHPDDKASAIAACDAMIANLLAVKRAITGGT